MIKYKFILTLDDDTQVDSAEEIEGHVAWPNWSQADPVHYRGIFDTYKEAEEYASEFSLYKYVLKGGYDSSNDEPSYFLSVFDAEDAVSAYYDVDPGEPISIYADNYVIEEVTEADEENEVPAGVFKYRFIYEGESVYDSLEDDFEYYDTHGNAFSAASHNFYKFKIETDDYPCDFVYPIEDVSFQIVEFDDEEENE